jgi:hypothetical protein
MRKHTRAWLAVTMSRLTGVMRILPVAYSAEPGTKREHTSDPAIHLDTRSCDGCSLWPLWTCFQNPADPLNS